MARRRMIDPNIWGSEDMSKLTIRQRLLVIGLFSNADDEGKGKAKPAYVRSTIFPYDDIPIPEVIDDLETIRAVITIHFYEVEGNSYYKFLNWNKWQRVDKPQPSIIPEPVENDSGMIPDQFLPKGKEEKIKEGKGTESPPILSLSDNLYKDRIHELLKACQVESFSLHTIDVLASYVNMVDFEVIEAAIKKSQGKHANYPLKTIEGMIKDGITTKEQLYPKPKVVNAPPKKDLELEARHREIAFNKWIENGGDPSEFEYRPAASH